MAKNISIFPLSGSLGNVVFTKGSKIQGVRAKRGTYKPATLNNTLSANAGRSAYLNALASPLYRLLCNIAGIYRDGGAWARILSRFKSCASDDPLVLLDRLRDMNMHERYPIGRCWMVPNLVVSNKAKRLLVETRPGSVPHFKGIEYNQYRYHLSALLRNHQTGEWEMDTAFTEWFNKNDSADAYEFEFNKPAGNGVCVLCIRLEAGLNGRADGGMRGVSVHVLGAWGY